MSQFVVCEVCGRHAIRGVHTCSKCGNDLSLRKGRKVDVNKLPLNIIDYSKVETTEQSAVRGFKGDTK